MKPSSLILSIIANFSVVSISLFLIVSGKNNEFVFIVEYNEPKLLEFCNSFNKSFFPETIRNKLIETTEKLSIIDKINLDGFKQKTATLLINIYYDLEREKEYTVDELKTVWAKRNAELEYNTKEEYSFEVTLNNLLKAGFLNGKTYLVNL